MHEFAYLFKSRLVCAQPNNKLLIKELVNIKRGNFVTHVLEASARRVEHVRGQRALDLCCVTQKSIY